MRKINPELFTWSRWRVGGEILSDLALVLRQQFFDTEMRKRIRNHAVGFCEGERLLCRPKPNHRAVMLYHNGMHGWFHLRNSEFDLIWENENE